MKSVLPLLVAVVVLALLIGAVALAVKYSGPKKKDYELPTSPCPTCGTVNLIWSDPFCNEPSHRYCDCDQRSLRWDKWEERVETESLHVPM